MGAPAGDHFEVSQEQESEDTLGTDSPKLYIYGLLSLNDLLEEPIRQSFVQSDSGLKCDTFEPKTRTASLSGCSKQRSLPLLSNLLATLLSQWSYHSHLEEGCADAWRCCSIINLRAKHSEPLHVRHPAKVIAASEPAELAVDK